MPPSAFLYHGKPLQSIWPCFSQEVGGIQSPRFRKGERCRNVLCVCVGSYLYWAVRSKSGAVFVYHFSKSQLALDIGNAPVPEKVNSILESTAFRSKRQALEKQKGDTSQCGLEPGCAVSLHGSVYEKHIPCNHGAFFLAVAFRSFQTGHSL